MNFTREDILKIKWALDRYSVKDSELLDADFPMQYNDTISIVLNGVNKKISIKEFIWQVGLLAKDGIFNVTDIFNKPNITLNEAIKIIPYSNRKEGLVITFLDENGEWRIYQFRGSINQFNNESLWKDLYDFSEYVIKSILPDEEDLTMSKPDKDGNSLLSLKDREYDPQNFSGMATKILRKHIVEVDDSEFGKVKKNILYQDDFDLENCIYEIRYDFTLTEDITIPDNCILEFDGGSLSNGTITGNTTKIFSSEIGIFDGISISGTWIVNEIFSTWFKDATSNNVLKELFNLCSDAISNTVYIRNGNYTVSIGEETYGEILKPKSNTNIIIDGSITLTPTNKSSYRIIYINNKKNITISGSGSIVGDKTEHIGNTGEHGHGISIQGGSENINVSKITISNCWGDGICIENGFNNNTINKNITISNFTITNTRRQGISIILADTVEIFNGSISDISGTDPQSCIDIEPNTNLNCRNINIHNIKCTGLRGIITAQAESSSVRTAVENIIIKDCELSCSEFNIDLRAGVGIVIQSNIIEHNGDNAFTVRIQDNRKHVLFINNMVNSSHDVFSIYNCGDNTLFENNIFNVVKAFYTTGATIRNNKIACTVLWDNDSNQKDNIFENNYISANTFKTTYKNIFKNNKFVLSGIFLMSGNKESELYDNVIICDEFAPDGHFSRNNITCDYFDTNSSAVICEDNLFLTPKILLRQGVYRGNTFIQSAHNNTDRFIDITTATLNDNVIKSNVTNAGTNVFINCQSGSKAKLFRNTFISNEYISAIIYNGSNSDIYFIDNIYDTLKVVDINNNYVYPIVAKNGNTRPADNNCNVGLCFFDESITPPRPIWYKGSGVWVDATGTTV